MGSSIVITVIFLGIFLFVLSTAVLYENNCRRRDGRIPYFALNRFGSWQEDSFMFAQTITAAFFLMGATMLVYGIYLVFKIGFA